jgi:hypothetical protein
MANKDTYSTSWAAAAIFNGLEGTNPTVITKELAPDNAEAIDSVESDTEQKKVYKGSFHKLQIMRYTVC